MKKASIDNQTQRSFHDFSWEQLIINGNLVIIISTTNADEKTIATKTNKQKTVHYLSVNNRPLQSFRLFRWFCFGCFVSVVSFRCFGF